MFDFQEFDLNSPTLDGDPSGRTVVLLSNVLGKELDGQALSLVILLPHSVAVVEH